MSRRALRPPTSPEFWRFSKERRHADAARLGAHIYDELGRTIETRQYEPGGCYIAVKTGLPGTRLGYDAFGRVLALTNPYRPTCSESAIWTTMEYDALGRVTEVTTETDNAVVINTHSGNVTTVRDQAGKQRRSTTDALGRLISMEELYAYPSSSVYAQTDYTYDVLDDLVTVEQVDQMRTFGYDSLGRQTSASNPESGTVYYQYDANGNLTQKTDARSVVTTYSYDDINRLTGRSYNDGTASVTFAYDETGVANSKGRLTSVSSNVSTYTYDDYDEAGRVLQSTQTTGSAGPFTMYYGYNLAGGLVEETYPSGRVVSTNYDTAARVSQVTGQRSGESNRTYMSSFDYWPHGAAKSVLLGSGKYEHTGINGRLQVTEIGLGTSTTDSSLLGLSYGYGSSTNNGNVVSQTIYAPGQHTWSQSYSYDHVNRLSEATESGVWSQTYSYDCYGNRAVTAGNILNGTLTPQSLSAFSSSTNHLVASTYDYAGNQMVDAASNTFAYDAENLLKTFNSTAGTYSYDGEGRRVNKNDSTGATVFVYDALGRLLAEYAEAEFQGSAVTRYLTQDHLGSTRVVTDASGTVLARHDYLPFGEEIPASWGSRNSVTGYGASDSTRQRFSGKERDNESGLDYFLARYYSGAQGRFTSPDPENAGAIPEDPQSWNAYAYARNNPLKYTDPMGLSYRLCDTSGNCMDNYSDADFRQNFKFNGAITLDEELHLIYVGGKLIGSYEHIGFDDFTARQQAFFDQMSGQREATKGLIADLAAESVANGVVGFFVGVAFRDLMSAIRTDEAREAIRFGIRTGRSVPTNLKEQLAMQQAKANPSAGVPVRLTMNDPRWPASEGWVKMRQNINGVEIHYVRNLRTGQMADFKFK